MKRIHSARCHIVDVALAVVYARGVGRLPDPFKASEYLRKNLLRSYIQFTETTRFNFKPVRLKEFTYNFRNRL